jgi:hypothetical protein
MYVYQESQSFSHNCFSLGGPERVYLSIHLYLFFFHCNLSSMTISTPRKNVHRKVAIVIRRVGIPSQVSKILGYIVMEKLTL